MLWICLARSSSHSAVRQRCQGRFDLFRSDGTLIRGRNAGGITRDVLIGAVPPAAISDWRYLGVSLLAGLVTFFWYPDIDKRRRLVLLLDGAGLGLFAVAGTQKALIADSIR